MIKNSKNISFIKGSKDQNGWMGNMCGFFAGTPLKIKYNDIIFNDSETLFQWFRVKDKIIKSEIVRSSNGYESKKIFKTYLKEKGDDILSHPLLSPDDVYNMIKCVELKLIQHPFLLSLLSETKQYIIEDVSERRGGNSLFWGAALVGDWWIGTNMLGLIYESAKKYIYSLDETKKENLKTPFILNVYGDLLNNEKLKSFF